MAKSSKCVCRSIWLMRSLFVCRSVDFHSCICVKWQIYEIPIVQPKIVFVFGQRLCAVERPEPKNAPFQFVLFCHIFIPFIALTVFFAFFIFVLSFFPSYSLLSIFFFFPYSLFLPSFFSLSPFLPIPLSSYTTCSQVVCCILHYALYLSAVFFLVLNNIKAQFKFHTKYSF